MYIIKNKNSKKEIKIEGTWIVFEVLTAKQVIKQRNSNYKFFSIK